DKDRLCRRGWVRWNASALRMAPTNPCRFGVDLPMKDRVTALLRIINELLVPVSITLLTLVVLDALLPGFSLSNVRSALVGIVLIGIANSVILPIAVRLTLPIHFLTFGLLPLVLNGLIVLIVSRIVPGFEVHDIFAGI